MRAGGEAERATVAGRDPSTDLALLRIDAAGPVTELASSDGLRVGAIVLAVARDDDGDVAASMGVLSAVGGPWRTWHGGQIDRFVRPDLSLYPRFAGSPLVDVSGRIAGMNTGGLARRQVLTVPADTIRGRVDETARRRRAHPPRLPRRRAAAVDGGAIVLGVAPNGPAARAGILVGDVIVAIGGEAVEDADDVHARLGPGTAGKELAIDLRRAGAPVSLRVTAGDRPERE